MRNILVTGAFGQLGTELIPALRKRYGGQRVVASGRHLPQLSPDQDGSGPVVSLDVTNAAAVLETVREYRVEVIYHLAAILSARGEASPEDTWRINVGGLRNVLEAARIAGCKVFWPSSIAVFGPDTPAERTPQDTVMRPTTMYGITKVTGELLADYYVSRFGIDVRGVRYPGVISSESLPGGGTTDYAVEMFYGALRDKQYSCFVRANTVLPMIYMPDCIRAAIEIMEADFSQLTHHNGFNVAAMSFSAAELAAEIEKHLPGFTCQYEPDERQAIADSWPRSIDDQVAFDEWGWRAEYDLPKMTADMLKRLAHRLSNH